MTFEEYQKAARATAIYPTEYAIVYPTLGLCGESGEVAERIKKLIRDRVASEEVRTRIVLELGDVLWYIANLASDMDISLETIAASNVEKLHSRKERNTLHGSG